MKWRARRLVVVGTACGGLLIAGASAPSLLARHSSVDAVSAPSSPVYAVDDGERWLTATLAALDNATEVHLPFEGHGELDGAAQVAVAYELRGWGGQELEVNLRRDASAAAPIYVEVFRVVDVLGQPLHERLTALRPNASSVSTRLPSDGVYHVLVQTDATSAGHYGLTLELDAALPFPVVGAEAGSIGSPFGASRDAGARNHEGVDIFVQRLTPVLAVAAGSAMPRQDALGGNTVWLNTPGMSYYYAHLDRVAVRDQQRVRAGDVLGYVGNTGNANAMPAHLHFGVYRWGREPIDPLPLLVGQRFEGEQGAVATANAGD